VILYDLFEMSLVFVMFMLVGRLWIVQLLDEILFNGLWDQLVFFNLFGLEFDIISEIVPEIVAYIDKELEGLFLGLISYRTI